MKTIERAVHIDFHTMPAVPDVGRDFDPEAFAATLKNARVDYVNVFARCNLGFAYYPTKTGIRHPSLRKDLLGGMVRECHKRGIGVSAYINLGYDNAHAKLHRDWCTITRDGLVSIRMCISTGYGDYVLAMVREILSLYPVDGLFLDCFSAYRCVGEECAGPMRTAGIDPENDQANMSYCYDRQFKFVKRIKKLSGDDRMFYVNGFEFKEQKQLASHFEIECLPTGGWGYDSFPSSVRYTRNLGKQVLGMTARFHKSWGDFGGLKPSVSLDYDCYNAISNGVACSIGDHMHPRSTLERDVYELIGSTYRKIEALAPWTRGAIPVTEIGILSDSFTASSSTAGNEPVTGATRILGELKQQFDVIDPYMGFSRYRLLVLPDDVRVDSKLKAKLAAYIDKGGCILSTGRSGMDTEQDQFALNQWGVRYDGPEEYSLSYFSALKPLANRMPEMPLTIYKPGIRIRAAKGSRTLARHIDPYFDDRKEGFHAFTYVPPDQPSRRPAIVRHGNVIHVCFPLFGNYAVNAVTQHRTLVENCIGLLLPSPLLRVANLPSFARVTMTRLKNITIVHILNYCPEKRGSLQVIEDEIESNDVTLALRCRGTKRVYTAPERTSLPFSRDEDRTVVTIPTVKGYSMVVFE